MKGLICVAIIAASIALTLYTRRKKLIKTRRHEKEWEEINQIRNNTQAIKKFNENLKQLNEQWNSYPKKQ